MQENRVRSSRHPISNSGTERTPVRSGTPVSAPDLKPGTETDLRHRIERADEKLDRP